MAPPRGKKRKIGTEEPSSSLDSASESTQASKSRADEILVERSSVWFEDGNVVLIAEGKGFKYIRLLDHNVVLKFAEVSALLRLGSKYQVERIRDEAIRRLRQCFPEKLEDYATARTRSELFSRKIGRDYYCNASISLAFLDCRDTIDLARSHNLDDLLPAAFHAFASAPTVDILEWGTPGGIQDILRVLEGRERLDHAARRNLHAAASLVSTGDCKNPERCRSARVSLVRQLAVHRMARNLCLLDHGMFESEFHIYVCAPCTKLRNDLWEEKRAETWSKLREYFDLPPASAPVADDGQLPAND
ncbi:hypothetical protein EIP91_000482 [Steccherinum ochraceum]|uniref:BTB domain-containing protein n=1 Tax=Steccherinum ochraceum TaxID=92696 RepID=A0A4R0S329_9APHY|nr:hypothetical protein EIP91_000482 [Steccherinum ochraceum]